MPNTQNTNESRSEKWSRWVRDSRHSLAAIGVLSFLESTVLPIMIEFVMVPFLLARRKQIWLISTIVLVGCVLGALVGYGIGRFFFESAGQWLIDTFGLSGGMEKFRNLFDDYGFGALILVCITPIPFQAAMLAAGAASYSLPMFLLATLIGRGIRYYGLAAIVALMGEKAEEVWQKHTFWITAGTVIVVVLTYVISSFSIF